VRLLQLHLHRVKPLVYFAVEALAPSLRSLGRKPGVALTSTEARSLQRAFAGVEDYDRDARFLSTTAPLNTFLLRVGDDLVELIRPDVEFIRILVNREVWLLPNVVKSHVVRCEYSIDTRFFPIYNPADLPSGADGLAMLHGIAGTEEPAEFLVSWPTPYLIVNDSAGLTRGQHIEASLGRAGSITLTESFVT
jgi:hypothetical protein